MDKRRIGVRGIIYRDGKILAVKHYRKNSTASFWCVPGGGLDPLEPVINGVEREIVEELGVKPVVGRLVLVQQMVTSRVDSDEELELFFAIDNPEDFAAIDLSSTSHGAAEIAEFGFIEPSEINLLPSALKDPELLARIESGQGDVYIHNELDTPPVD